MRFSTIVVAAFAGLAIAAPTSEVLLDKRQLFPAAGAAPAAAAAVPEDTKSKTKAKKGFGWKAFGLGALAVWGAQKLGIFSRDLEAINNKPLEEMDWSELGEYLADDAVKYLSQAARPDEATICVDVPYTVDNDALARVIGGFVVEAGDANSTYDCFTLSGPNRFVVDLTQANATADSVAVVPGPGQWNETLGLLTL